MKAHCSICPILNIINVDVDVGAICVLSLELTSTVVTAGGEETQVHNRSLLLVSFPVKTK